MNEQQRITLAMAICVGIFVAASYTGILGEPPPPPVEQNAKTQPTGDNQTEDSQGIASKEGAPDAVVGEANTEAQPAAQVVAQVVAPQQRPLKTSLYNAQVQNGDASLTAFSLVGFDERPDPTREDEEDYKPGPVSLVKAAKGEQAKQAKIGFSIDGKPGPAMDFVGPQGSTSVQLSGTNSQGVRTSVTIFPRSDAYALDYQVSIYNGSGTAIDAKASSHLSLFHPQVKGGLMGAQMQEFFGECFVEGSTERQDFSDVEEGPYAPKSPALWGGIDLQYFLAAVVPSPTDPGQCTVSAKGRTMAVDFMLAEKSIAPGDNLTTSFVLYMGPKDDKHLGAISEELKDSIHYNIWGIPMAFLAMPMVSLLRFFHDWTANWGLAIILLTLFIKSILFPLTFKSTVSMRKFQLLKPQIDELKEKYGSEPQRMQAEQMKLFRETGVNPLGGCLPMFLQMPIWFALYRSLGAAIELYGQPFLWLPDLTAKESGIPVLALAIGGLMFVQQRVTPTPTDNQQAIILRWVMPIMFTFFMFALPSGLGIYILANSVLSIGQMLAINKFAGPAPSAAGADNNNRPKSKKKAQKALS